MRFDLTLICRGEYRHGHSMNEQEIYIEALKYDADQRTQFLDKICGNNRELRQRMDRLFEHGRTERLEF